MTFLYIVVSVLLLQHIELVMTYNFLNSTGIPLVLPILQLLVQYSIQEVSMFKGSVHVGK